MTDDKQPLIDALRRADADLAAMQGQIRTARRLLSQADANIELMALLLEDLAALKENPKVNRIRDELSRKRAYAVAAVNQARGALGVE